MALVTLELAIKLLVLKLWLFPKGGSDFIPATPEAAVSGKYPLGRFLWVYVNKAPNKDLTPIEKEFLKMILSKEGQDVVIKDGYIPLSEDVVKKYLSQI